MSHIEPAGANNRYMPKKASVSSSSKPRPKARASSVPSVQDPRIPVERIQLGIRMEKRLVKVLKGLAEYKDMSLGMLLEEIALHSFESVDGEKPYSAALLRVICDLKKVYAMEYGLDGLYQLSGSGRSDAARQHLFKSVSIGDGVKAKKILAKYPDLLEARAEREMTPLIVAARDGHEDVAGVLISRGASVEAVDAKHGDTALGWAVFYGREGVVKLLLESGANPNHIDRLGSSPLAYSVAGERGVLRERHGITASNESFRAISQALRKAGAKEVVGGAARGPG